MACCEGALVFHLHRLRWSEQMRREHLSLFLGTHSLSQVTKVDEKAGAATQFTSSPKLMFFIGPDDNVLCVLAAPKLMSKMLVPLWKHFGSPQMRHGQGVAVGCSVEGICFKLHYNENVLKQTSTTVPLVPAGIKRLCGSLQAVSPSLLSLLGVPSHFQSDLDAFVTTWVKYFDFAFK